MSTKTARLDLRLTEEQRDLLEQAATIAGSSVAGYSIAALIDAAARSVAQSRRLILSQADWDDFIAALDAPDDAAWQQLRALTPVWQS